MRWRAGIGCALLLVGTLAFAACGNHQVVQGFSPGSSAAGKTSPEGLPAPVAGLDYQTALVELDELACPAGVDEGLWAELKEALEEALISQEESRLSSRDLVLKESRLENRDSFSDIRRFASTPPTGETNRVNDLGITDNGDGTFTLNWHYRNLGDYDQDGKVGISDITPLAEHFGESVPESDTERNSLPAVIDGSGNGRIGIEDVTPIAVNYAVDVQHYAVEGADTSEGPWESVFEAAQDTGSGEGRLEYSAIIQSPAALWHQVVPYDAEGNPGEPSNAVLRPSNEPVIYEVSPTSGYQHEEYTFTAVVTGAEPLTYAWDFGGSATPNTSSDTSPTVTLSDAGEYSCNLTITNSYGEADYPFTLTVSARDMWAHTWGGSWSDRCNSLVADAAGSVYIAGQTTSFGASGLEDGLLLKYRPDGDLVWARTYGGDAPDRFLDVEVDSHGSVYVVGETSSFGAGRDDLLLLKYDVSGVLVWAVTWGTSEYERASGMAVDAEGNIYVCGYYLVYGGVSDILLTKFSSDGDILWARTWGGEGEERARDVCAATSAIYVCGYTESFGAGAEDLLLMKWGEGGELQCAVTAGGSGMDTAAAVLFNNDNIYLAGSTSSFGQGRSDALVIKCDLDGIPLWARTWGSTADEYLSSLAMRNGRLICVGNMTWYGTSVLVLESSSNEWPVAGYRWIGNGSKGLAATVDKAGDVFIGGIAASNTGEWSERDGIASDMALTIGPAGGMANPIDGTQTLPAGTENAPEGILDAGGGGEDVLLLKNDPR